MGVDRKTLSLLAEVAQLRERWGKHSGFGAYADWEVLDALLDVFKSGLLDPDSDVAELKAKAAAANRRAAASEAREKKYKALLDTSKREYLELVVALEEAQKKLEQKAS